MRHKEAFYQVKAALHLTQDGKVWRMNASQIADADAFAGDIRFTQKVLNEMHREGFVTKKREMSGRPGGHLIGETFSYKMTRYGAQILLDKE